MVKKVVIPIHNLDLLEKNSKKERDVSIYTNLQYLNEGDTDVIFHMSISIFDISHDEITQFSTELYSCWATSNNNTM